MSAVVVGIADLKIARAPDIITTIGLGSCVGVTVYDPATRIGGLVHILLPASDGKSPNSAKFADTGVPELIKLMVARGARRSSLVAKMAGGANMFAAVGGKSDIFMIGQRNVEMCVNALKNEHIKLARSDTGGTYGRTIELDTESGQLRIKTVGHGEKYI